jgi:hypothetical protein
MFRCLFYAPSALLVIPALLAGCATAPAQSASQGWRPLAPDAVAERCQGAAAEGCYQEAIQALAATPPRAAEAQNLLGAACEAKSKSACEALDERFHAPSAIRVPTVSAEPPYGMAVLEFTCQVTSKGYLQGCERTRSANSPDSLNDAASRQVSTGQPASLFRPATLDGTPYDTEVRLVYVLRSSSIGGPIIVGMSANQTAGRPRNNY